MTISRNPAWATNIALWEDAVQKSPEKPRAHFNLGAAYQNARRPEDAIRAYRRALELKPDIHAAYSNIAAMQIDSGQLDAAEETLQRVVSVAPDYTEGFINLSVLYLRRRETDKAIAAAERAIATSSESFAGEFNYAEALTQKGDFARAVEHYRKAAYLRPDLLEFRINLGLAYQRAGDRESAEKEFMGLMGTEHAPDALRHLAGLEIESRSFDKAAEYLQQAVAARAVFPDAHHDLGAVYLRREQPAEAIPHLRTTLQQQPDHGPATLNLALAYQMQGDLAGARDTLQRYIAVYRPSGSPYVAEAEQRLQGLPH
jgi:Flp pilus assembly protein TadD